MTGLDATKDRIVEIATIVTDDDLGIVAEGPDIVIHQPDDVLDAMSEFVRDMHERSGLLAEVRKSTTDLAAAGEVTLAFLREHIDEAATVPLCGNSIGTDRRFLAVWLPEIEDFLHYRSVDVSTIKELGRRWYPDAMGGAPRKTSGHRALDDIRESIEELRYYRSALFRPDADDDPASGESG